MGLISSLRGAIGGERRSARTPAFPDGQVGYAVGDIHGRADLLARMLDRLEDDARGAPPGQKPIVVFLGDYVDRGPASKDVIDLLLAGRPHGFERRFLCGNHEAMLLRFLEQPVKARDWLTTGGLDTVLSYGVPVIGAHATPAAVAAFAQAFRAALPEAHLAFLQTLERFVVLGDYALVHAGVDPDKAIERQSDADLFWIRKKFLGGARPYRYMVIHGHTPIERPYRDARRIGIDTGAYLSGRLTAVKLHGEQAEFISVGCD